MRILIYTRAFLPSVGGLEVSVAQIAEEFVRCGHEVVVITTTSGNGNEGLPFPVLRNPGPYAFLRRMRWCDVFHQPNVSLRGLWPMLLAPRPWIVTHHSWYRRPDGRIAWQDRIKRCVLRFAAASIAVSKAIADDLPTPSVVISNTYLEHLFRPMPDIERSCDLVFLGRLVSDKGVDILLDALSMLAQRGERPALTIVGEGPERIRLERQAQQLGLMEQVIFRGQITGTALVEILNRHKVLVVPSRYREPFGIVALEGIACGCAVIGSEGGGLSDAIGPCGITFPNGDARSLEQAIRKLLYDPSALSECRARAKAHLAGFRTERIVQGYVSVFEAARRHTF